MDDGQNNGGIFNKFRERLRKIRISRSKKKVKNDEFIQEKIQEIRTTIRQESVPVYKSKTVGKDHKMPKEEDRVSNVIVEIKKTAPDRMVLHKKVGNPNIEINKDSNIVEDEKINGVSVHDESVFIETNKEFSVEKDDKINNVPIADEVFIARPRKHQKFGHSIDRRKENVHTNEEKKELLENLGTEIIDKIKNNFEDKIDELQILMSELYFLKQAQDNELEIKKVKEIKEKINNLIQRVNNIIEQYNLYKSNYYIDYVIDLDDNVLVDDIIQYRDLLDSLSSEKEFVKEYKALDEFKSLYLNLKVVRDDTEKLVESNEKKIEEFDIRDKKYNDIKLQMVPISDINKECSLEIARQNEYFTKLMQKVDIINKEEYTTTHLRGLGELVRSSLNYMGLLMLSPLSGLIPSIAVQTLVTKKMIGNIYQHMHVEEVRHIQYNAINYDIELSHHLTNIDYTANLLDDTLSDIERLKEEFLSQYDSRIPGYMETLKNINEIQKKLYQNQNRLEIVRKNLKKSKKVNDDKLKRVRQLNDSQKSI